MSGWMSRKLRFAPRAKEPPSRARRLSPTQQNGRHVETVNTVTRTMGFFSVDVTF